MKIGTGTGTTARTYRQQALKKYSDLKARKEHTALLFLSRMLMFTFPFQVPTMPSYLTIDPANCRGRENERERFD